ncbi:MAG: hypothetical protein LBC74_15760 [Planctomycetaceae bacterium]|jgi:hypothetical protein|nr:hypothetical protein [Planctomycetaceae bacterium]
MKKNYLTMVIVGSGCVLLFTAFLLTVLSNTMPGETATEITLSRTVAGATIIKGYCSNGSACEYDAGGCPTNDGITCLASINAKVCGIAEGLPNQTCNSDPESPYSCVTDLPTQTCTSLDKRCEQTSEGCICSTIYGGVVPAWGGTRTVC